jgi:HlyD family secretion protein
MHRGKVQPGTVLLTLVPVNEPLHAEVWVGHEDTDFVRAGRPVMITLAAYPIQKYGMIPGQVARISPDVSDATGGRGDRHAAGEGVSSGYRTVVSLDVPYLEADAKRYPLSPGMQVTAEINLGTRTMLGYLLSPVRRTLHEAERER